MKRRGQDPAAKLALGGLQAATKVGKAGATAAREGVESGASAAMKHAWNITKAQRNENGGRKAKMTTAVGYSPWPRRRYGIPQSAYSYTHKARSGFRTHTF